MLRSIRRYTNYCAWPEPNGGLAVDYLNVHYCENHLLPRSHSGLNRTTYDIEKWDDKDHFYKKIK
jgi:hypothetical protein